MHLSMVLGKACRTQSARTQATRYHAPSRRRYELVWLRANRDSRWIFAAQFCELWGGILHSARYTDQAGTPPQKSGGGIIMTV